MTDGAPSLPRDLTEFIDASPSPYHAVAEAVRRLETAGFTRLTEHENWSVAPGAKAYLVRGGGTLIAARLGLRPPAETGFLLVAAHTDSPGLRVKPVPDVRSQSTHQLGVEVYGSPLWYTWLDRDLSIAGRVVVRGGAAHLVRFGNAVCRIPSLALHLDRSANDQGPKLNPQQHLLPMLRVDPLEDAEGFRHLLAARLAATAGAETTGDDILAYDLCLHDSQPAALGGVDGALVFAPRLDDLVGCHAALRAFLSADPREATQVLVLYDHEETGSLSASGAQSRLLMSVLERLVSVVGDGTPQSAHRALAKSLLVSVDMAHAVHPNYPDKHDQQHRPLLGRGPVLKVNANQSYATDGPAAAVFVGACLAQGFEPQRYVARNDLRCGSTLGPITAARTSIRTVDVGNAMLSMHSCREVAAAHDADLMTQALTEVLNHGVVPPAEY